MTRVPGDEIPRRRRETADEIVAGIKRVDPVRVSSRYRAGDVGPDVVALHDVAPRAQLNADPRIAAKAIYHQPAHRRTA